MEKYIVITNSEDGEVSMHVYDKEQLLAEINDEESRLGRKQYGLPVNMYDMAADLNPNTTIIIKGEGVVPLKKQVIVELDIE